MTTRKNQKLTVTVAPGERANRTRKKAAAASANESGMTAELKNNEHGNEQPAR